MFCQHHLCVIGCEIPTFVSDKILRVTKATHSCRPACLERAKMQKEPKEGSFQENISGIFLRAVDPEFDARKSPPGVNRAGLVLSSGFEAGRASAHCTDAGREARDFAG